MPHAQIPDFVFRRNGRVHLNRRRASVQSTTGSRAVRISDSNAGYTMLRSSVKSTVYPLHSPVSPSLTLPCVTVCHHISTGLYQYNRLIRFRRRLIAYLSWGKRSFPFSSTINRYPICSTVRNLGMCIMQLRKTSASGGKRLSEIQLTKCHEKSFNKTM